MAKKPLDGWVFEEVPDPVAEAEARGSPWASAMRRAARALERKWAADAPAKPERVMEFTVRIHCTRSEFQEIKGVLKCFPRRKWFREGEIPNDEGSFRSHSGRTGKG